MRLAAVNEFEADFGFSFGDVRILGNGRSSCGMAVLICGVVPFPASPHNFPVQNPRLSTDPDRNHAPDIRGRTIPHRLAGHEGIPTLDVT